MIFTDYFLKLIQQNNDSNNFTEIEWLFPPKMNPKAVMIEYINSVDDTKTDMERAVASAKIDDVPCRIHGIWIISRTVPAIFFYFFDQIERDRFVYTLHEAAKGRKCYFVIVDEDLRDIVPEPLRDEALLMFNTKRASIMTEQFIQKFTVPKTITKEEAPENK